MLKWFNNNAKIIGIGWAVMLSAAMIIGLLYGYAPLIVFTASACLAGVFILGLIVRVGYHMGRDEGYVIVAPEQGECINNTSDTNNNLVNKKSQLDTNVSSPSVNIMTRLFGFFCSPRKTPTMIDELLEAIARCKEETDKQNSEVVLINDALKEFNREGQLLINQYRQGQALTGDRLFQVANEQTIVPETRGTVERSQLLDELVYLTANYPKSGYKENPCIETVELYLDARTEHHEKIVSIANVLLPDWQALIISARAAAQELPSRERQNRFA